MRMLAPWGGDLQREMKRFFDRFELLEDPLEAMAGDWKPSLDLAETKEAMVVTADMPGVDPKEISITLTGDLLTIKGERDKATGATEKDARYHRVERSYGAFVRSVRLPITVDGSKVTATFKHGVLVVTLPKTPASKGTMIPVKTE